MYRGTGFSNKNFEELRLVTKIVTLYYHKGFNQAEIANQLGLSRSKVNRLFTYAHDQGIVEININSPLQLTFDIENRIKAIFDIREAIVVPAVLDDTETLTESVGSAGARYLETHIRDGDTIVVGGGTTMLSLVRQLAPKHTYDVTVLPIEGGLQGNIITDVNHVVSVMARTLGGNAQALHAPAFVDSVEERDMLLKLSEVSRVLRLTRNANIAVFGMGHCNEDSRFAMFTGLSPEDMTCIRDEYGGVGEIGSMVFDIAGKPTAKEYAEKVVGLTLRELKKIPLSIGVAATAEKALPIYAALIGKYIDVLITDELAAQAVLDQFDRDFRRTRLDNDSISDAKVT